MWNKKNNITTIIVPIFIIGTGFVCFPLFESSATYTKNIFYIIIGLFVIIFALLFLKNLSINLTAPIIITSLLLLYNIVYNIDAQKIIIAYILTTILLLQIFSNICFSRKTVIYVIKSSAFVMTILCTLQFGGISPLYTNSIYNATFDNPSGVSIFLSVCFPFILTDYCKNHSISSTLLLALISIVILFIPSRSGIVSILGVCSLFMLTKAKFRIIKVIALPNIAAISGLIISLFWLKSGSSFGRLLIYAVSLQLGTDNLLFGQGVYGFSANYMNYQGKYFCTHPNSMFANFADETMHPLNEYINLFINNGFLGVVLVLLLFWELYKKWNIDNIEYYGCLLAISIQSLFTYTLRYSFVWFFIVLCLSQITRNQLRLYPMALTIRLFSIIICILISYITVKDVIFEYRWHKIAKEKMSNIVLYQKLNKSWNGNPFFLYNYAAILHQHFQFEQSNQKLKEYEGYVSDYYACLMMANNYYALENYDLARTYYEKASWMCPVRFLPLQGLLRSYKKMNELEKANSIAKSIVEKKPKIKSYTISVIKAEASNYLNNEKRD